MLIVRREGFPAAPIKTGTVRPKAVRQAQPQEGRFDQITLSGGGQEHAPTFRELAASLSQQVRTFNTTGKIADLHEQVAAGTYRPDARETAARMLLMTEGE